MHRTAGFALFLRGVTVQALAVAIGVIGLWGAIASVRFTFSSLVYRHARFARHSGGEGAVRRAAELAQSAYRIDPDNHPFWSWLSDGLVAAYGASGDPDMLAGAALWSERGLAANRFGWRINVTRAKVLAEKSPDEAVRFWGLYVDWHYWEPFNHAYLAELHARAGDTGSALHVLRRIEGLPYHKQTLQIVTQWAGHQRSAIP